MVRPVTTGLLALVSFVVACDADQISLVQARLEAAPLKEEKEWLRNSQSWPNKSRHSSKGSSSSSSSSSSSNKHVQARSTAIVGGDGHTPRKHRIGGGGAAKGETSGPGTAEDWRAIAHTQLSWLVDNKNADLDPVERKRLIRFFSKEVGKEVGRDVINTFQMDASVHPRPPVVVWDTERLTGICLSPKNAVSTIFDYLHWTRIGVPGACKYGPGHIDGAEQKCRDSGADWGTESRYQSGEKPFKDYSIEDAVKLDAQNASLVIPYRDPWVRLMSGFRSKMIHICKESAECFQEAWVPWFSLDESKSLLHRFIDAVTRPGREKGVDVHFRTQSRECLKSAPLLQSKLRVVPALVDKDDGLDVVSDAFAPGKASLNSFLTQDTEYKWSDHGCFDVEPFLFMRVLTYLQSDYTAAKKVFGTHFDSHAMLLAAAKRDVASMVCVANSTIVEKRDLRRTRKRTASKNKASAADHPDKGD